MRIWVKMYCTGLELMFENNIFGNSAHDFSKRYISQKNYTKVNTYQSKAINNFTPCCTYEIRFV